jgi:hypothetical protein
MAHWSRLAASALTICNAGNMILAPMRVGVGYQIGVSLGYLKFAPSSGWFPF